MAKGKNISTKHYIESRRTDSTTTTPLITGSERSWSGIVVCFRTPTGTRYATLAKSRLIHVNRDKRHAEYISGHL